MTVAATAEKIGWVREAAGDRADQLEFNIYPSMTEISVTDHARREAQELSERLHARSGVTVSADELLASPHIFISSVEGWWRSSAIFARSWGSARSWSARSTSWCRSWSAWRGPDRPSH